VIVGLQIELGLELPPHLGEHVLGQQLPGVQAGGVLEQDVVVLRDGHVVEEPERRSLRTLQMLIAWRLTLAVRVNVSQGGIFLTVRFQHTATAANFKCTRGGYQCK